MPLASTTSREEQSHFSNGVQTSVSGHMSGPPPGAAPLPSVFRNNDTKLLGSMQGLISDQRAVLQATKNAMDQLTIVAQRLTVMYDGSSGTNSNQRTGLLNQQMAAGTGRDYGPTNTPMLGINAAHAGFGTSAANYASTPIPGSTQIVRPPAPPQSPLPSAPEPPKEGLGSEQSLAQAAAEKRAEDAKRNQHIKDIKEAAVADEFSKSKREIESDLGGTSPTDLGRHGLKSTIGGISRHAGERLSNWAAKIPDDETGSFRSKVANKLLGNSAIREKYAAGTGPMGGVVGSASEGDLMGAAAGLVPFEAAGPIGLALGAGAYGIHEAEQMRQQGAQYQAIEGGSTAGGVAESFRQKAFGLSQMGEMDYGQATQLFQGVTAMNVKGGQRQDFMDMAIDKYNKLGMSVTQSLQFLSIAAQNGTKNLTQLSGSIDQVSATASSAGGNAEIARAGLLNVYSQLSSGLSGPTNATPTSAAIQGEISNGGKLTSGIKFNAQGTQGDAERAGQMGLSLPQYSAKAAGPGGAAFVAEAQQRVNDKFIGSTTGYGGQTLQQFVQGYMKQHPNTIASKANANSPFMQALTKAGFSPDTIAQSNEAAAGYANVSPNALGGILIPQLSGSTLQSNTTKDQARSVLEGKQGADYSAWSQSMNSADRKLENTYNKARNSGIQGAVKAALGPAAGLFAGGAVGGIAKSIGNFFAGGGGPNAQETEAYNYMHKQGETNNSNIEDLMLHYDPMRQYQIKNKQGALQTVSAQTAFSKYMPQIASGQAVIKGGKGAGKTIEQEDKTYHHGMDPGAKRIDPNTGKPQKQSTSGGNQKVTIGLTPAAQQLFQVVNGSGINTTENAQMPPSQNPGF